MSAQDVYLGLLVALVIIPATLGFVFDQLRRNYIRRPILLTADNVRAAARLAYYNEVQDSAVR